jgi:peptidoglycan/xylan/chitin deacetylase (PgdA/CDA1 family)
MRNLKFAATFLAFAILVLPALSAQNEVFILTYHTFIGSKKSSLDFTPQDMGEQLDAIAKLGYTFVTPDDVRNNKIQGANNVMITIDDGNHSVYPAYEQVFKPRGIKPVLFVYPGVIGRTKFALTVAQLKEMADSGYEIGAHGYYHEYLSAKAFAANRQKCLKEIEGPGAILAKESGKPIKIFAYPFGEDCLEADELVKKNGYEMAFLAGNDLVPVDFSSPSLNRYAIPRIIVYHWNKKAILSKLARFAATGESPAAPKGKTPVTAIPTTQP